jgi:carboxypeptidase PM20D1
MLNASDNTADEIPMRLLRITLFARNLAILLFTVGSLACAAGDDSNQVPVRLAPDIIIPEAAAARLAGAVRIPTISYADSAAFDTAAFTALHDYLQKQFPRAHAGLQREQIGYSLLYTWHGSDPALKPIALMGHLDVVPVEAGTESKWERAPFGGVVDAGFVWGRGAIDNKATITGALEAVEILIGEGFRPRRTLYLAFGHDEEVGGTRGARKIAELLKQRGIKLEMVLDEGGIVGDGIMPGVEPPTALVGVAEKGFVSVELIARASGGHSSLPPRESAIGILSAAIARIEENQMPARVEGATKQMFGRLSPHFPTLQRAVFANLWLTRPLVMRKLESSPTTNAMVRTTTAVTIFQAGTKENVLPTHARAVINFRILPGDNIADILEHVRAVVDDPRVEIKPAASFSAEPSAISRTTSDCFRAIERTVRSLAPTAVVAPYLVVVVTDSRFYADLTDNTYRFLPVRMAPNDLQRMHGINERIAVKDYEWAIRFYHQLISNATGN